MARKPALISNPIVTHLVAAALGLAVVWVLKPEPTGSDENGGRNGPRDFRSQKRTDRRGHGLGGDALLTSITGIPPGDMKKREWTLYSENMMRQVDEISRRANEVAPADDVAAAAQEALAKFTERPGEMSPEDFENLQVRLLHWLREDPRAALAVNFKRVAGGEQLAGILSAAVKEKGLVAATEWFGVNPMADTELRNSLSFLAGAEGDLGVMAALKGKVPPARWGEMRTLMAQSWKLDKADSLLAFATEEKAPAFVLLFASTQGPKGVDWLRNEMASGTIDPELQAGIMKKPEYKDLYL
ncbi:MAG TPA: hypothetical protein VM511_12435, partial [Luteolibacter sp.]|nr:hypothetical protein [Luteolibacter sp.]